MSIMNTQRKAARTLTVKQTKLVKGIAQGKSKRQSAIDAGYTGTPETISVTANEVLKNPNVIDALAEAIAKEGVTLDIALAPVIKAVRATVKIRVDGEVIDTGEDDLDMQLKGSDRLLKLMGAENKGEAGTTINNFVFMVDDKISKYRFDE